MEKRTLLALVLSLLVVGLYSFLMPHPQQPVNKEVTANITPGPAGTINPGSIPEAVTQPKNTTSQVALEHYHMSTDKLDLVFSNLGGNIEEVYLKDYKAHILASQFLGIAEFDNLAFSFEQSQNKALLTYKDSEVQIQKIFSFTPNSYLVNWELIITNLTNKDKSYDLHISNALVDLSKLASSGELRNESQFMEFSASLPDKIVRTNIGRINAKQAVSVPVPAKWIGVRSRYLCSVLQLRGEQKGYFTQIIGDKRVITGAEVTAKVLPNAPYALKAYLYAGPQDINVLKGLNLGIENIVNFGMFDVISQFMLRMLKFVHGFIPSWGICIMLFSLLVSLILYPLTFKALRSAKDMQALQPAMEALRKQYKDQPDKLNRELMELYRKHKINPLGGCLPMILQFPIFIALYQALMRSVDLKGASFLWIKDLSRPDRLFILPGGFQFMDNEINILPVVMALGMFLQQKMSMKSQASGSPEQQKMMLILFPIMFGVMFYRFPSGLTLYWTCYTLISLVLQKKLSSK